MRALLVLLAFAFATAGCAEAQSPTAAATPEGLIEVADGRTERPYVEHEAWERHAAVRAARDASRSHWQRQDPRFEEEFRVLDAVEGAFTRSGARQRAVLYLMSVEPRADPKTGLAVVEGDALVRNVALGGANGLVAIPDLDDDGRDELALLHSYGMGGSEETSLALVSLAEDAPVRSWGSTLLGYHSCGTGSPHASAETVRLLAAPGPAFLVERYRDAACEGRWTRDGEPEAIELDPPSQGSRGYTDLPVR